MFFRFLLFRGRFRGLVVSGGGWFLCFFGFSLFRGRFCCFVVSWWLVFMFFRFFEVDFVFSLFRGGVMFSSFRFVVISGRVLWVFWNFCAGVCILWRFCLEWGGERCIFAVLSF